MGAFCILSQNNGGVGAGNDIFGKLSQAPPPVVLRSIIHRMTYFGVFIS